MSKNSSPLIKDARSPETILSILFFLKKTKFEIMKSMNLPSYSFILRFYKK